jgi:glycosyltransferase involved in cell wall biosynthesis
VIGSEAGANNLRKLQGRHCDISVAAPLAPLAAETVTDRAFSHDSVLKFCLFAATLDHRKGAPQLLRLWNSIDVGPCQLHLWGHDTRNQLEERSHRLGLKNVHFHGAFHPSDLPQLMHATDIGLVLSLHEGYPLSAWEFMAFGVPFVVTPTGAAIEFTRNNPDCELADFSPEGVRAAIERIAQKVRSGHTSRQRLQQLQRSRFSYESAVERHLSYCFGLGALARAEQACIGDVQMRRRAVS